MKKECQFILLPTEKISQIYIQNEKLYFEKYPVRSIYAGNQFLYILSDDEIKEGDWCIFKYLESPQKIGSAFKEANREGGKKIIATTDPELKLPSISQSDVEYIISIYNGKNKEVDVDKLAEDSLGKDECFSELKESFVIGYNQCLEDNADKKFTLEDMKKCFDYARNEGKRRLTFPTKFEEYILLFTKEQPNNNTLMVEYNNITIFDNESFPVLQDGHIIIDKT